MGAGSFEAGYLPRTLARRPEWSGFGCTEKYATETVISLQGQLGGTNRGRWHVQRPLFRSFDQTLTSLSITQLTSKDTWSAAFRFQCPLFILYGVFGSAKLIPMLLQGLHQLL
jgi:hypothetical protein